jgi:hypothetical protein
MKKKMIEKLSKVIILLIFVAIGGGMILQNILFHRTIETLSAMNSQTVAIFMIYPRGSNSIDTPIVFTPPDPIIEGFFQSVPDFRSYWSRSEGVSSHEHIWLLEIAAKGKLIQMRCSIPVEKGNIVIGSLSELSSSGIKWNYGRFQSQKLFQWYQQHSHRWLGGKSQEERISIEIVD